MEKHIFFDFNGTIINDVDLCLDLLNQILNKQNKKTLSMEEYKTRLSEYKVYVCPATRQTGLGAIYNSISQGVKVYVNGVNYNWLKTLGFIVYSIDELQVSCNHEILEFSEEDRDFNIQHAKKIFGVHDMASKWESIFNILLDNE